MRAGHGRGVGLEGVEVGKVEELRIAFGAAPDPEAFITEHSGLPGPRGNIELAQAVADVGTERLFRKLLRWDPGRAPVNTPEELLPVCGVVGFGRLVAEGRTDLVPELRAFASDPRWRTREAVAMALQRWGRADMRGLLAEMRRWTRGNRLEQRAAAAGLCEPDLLTSARAARAVLDILDRITRSVAAAADRRDDAFKVLRQGLGYCWSVAVAALPDEGLDRLDEWMRSEDPDVRWIMRENLKKRRLVTIAGDRLQGWQKAVGAG
jgi:hypothetical protein